MTDHCKSNMNISIKVHCVFASSTRILFFAGVWGALAATTYIQAIEDVALDQRLVELESQMENIHTELRLAGLAAGVVQNNRLSWFKGIGFSDIENKVPVTQDTPFRIASLTKPIAATMLLQLVEDGRLDLDARATEFGIYNNNSELVTVRHILSHTSEGNPGEAYKYNGSRFDKLDKVIAQITGRSFEANLKERIIDPLKLKNTGRAFGELKSRLAKPYLIKDDNTLTPGEYPFHFGSAAGIVGSVSDYAAFVAAIETNQLLTPQTQELAFTPMKSPSGQDFPYGLGYFIETINERKVIWHYGSWVCISTLVVMVPEEDISLILFANTNGLSGNFDLGKGRLQNSPAASAFLEIFVPEKSGN